MPARQLQRTAGLTWGAAWPQAPRPTPRVQHHLQMVAAGTAGLHHLPLLTSPARATAAQRGHSSARPASVSQAAAKLGEQNQRTSAPGCGSVSVLQEQLSTSQPKELPSPDHWGISASSCTTTNGVTLGAGAPLTARWQLGRTWGLHSPCHPGRPRLRLCGRVPLHIAGCWLRG